MTRIQFWILSGTVGLVCLLFVVQTYLGYKVQTSSAELSRVEQLINQGRETEVRFRQIATRTYQLSQNDPTLRNVLVREQININVQPAPASAAAPAPQPAVSSAPISTNSVRDRPH
ncbi:MAG TPA: hypothetical protein VGC39_07585 [Candidatus Methylacidiphilales bacterium]